MKTQINFIGISIVVLIGVMIFWFFPVQAENLPLANQVSTVEATAASTTESTSNLYVVLKDGKAGYIDKTGKLVIQPQYEGSSASSFSEGLAAVEVGDKWGFID